MGDYGGGRDHDSIVSWVKKKTGAPTTKLADEPAVNAFAQQADAVLLGLFKEGDADFAEYEKAAGSIDEIQSGYTADEDLIAKYAPAKVVMIQKFDSKLAKFDGKMEAAAIKEFANANALPLVVAFTQESQGKIF